MRIVLLSAMTGGSLFALTAMADAEEVLTLSEADLDRVVARGVEAYAASGGLGGGSLVGLSGTWSNTNARDDDGATHGVGVGVGLGIGVGADGSNIGAAGSDAGANDQSGNTYLTYDHGYRGSNRGEYASWTIDVSMGGAHGLE